MIKIGTALIEATEILEREKGISKDVLITSLCDAMVTAYKKQLREKEIPNIISRLDEKKGEIGVFKVKKVVETVEDENLEITLEDAKKIDKKIEMDGEVEIEVTPENFGRIAAQSAKQVITQRIREAERKMVLDEFMDKKGTLVTGIIQRVEQRNVVINIGKSEAIMPIKEQIPGEYYKVNNRIRVYVLDVRETTKLPQVIVSHAHPEIVRELFELEVPEIEDGIVEIKAISREAGFRTKLAVWSNDPEVDAVGACIGHRGSRIQTIVSELKNEKIDIVRYSDDPVEFIVNALSPARIVSVDILSEDVSKEALVVVPDDQLSLAIGREGQNVRLAHRLTGWKIDIKNVSQMEEAGYAEGNYEEDAEYQEEGNEENPQEISEEIIEKEPEVFETEDVEGEIIETEESKEENE